MQSLKLTQVKQSDIHDALAVRPKLPAAAAAAAQTEPEDGADAEGGRKGGDRYSVGPVSGIRSTWTTSIPSQELR